MCMHICVRESVRVCRREALRALARAVSCADTRQREDSHAEEGERKGSKKEKELGGGGEEVS